MTRPCDRCGETAGIIQRVVIAWPDGRVVEAHLHEGCEDTFVTAKAKEGRRWTPGSS
jgi:hypothetical protein